MPLAWVRQNLSAKSLAMETNLEVQTQEVSTTMCDVTEAIP